MENQFIPAFEWHSVIVEPWSADFTNTLWIVLMGFFVTAGCGLVGTFLLLRRMALVGDAISHSILPGLIIAFVIAKESSIVAMFSGALGAGLVTVLLIEFIHKQSRVKPDAAICIAFTTLFALGVVMMSMLESKGSFHIDADCVLYGEIAFVGLEPPVQWRGMDIGPPTVLRMLGVLIAIGILVALFYKELLVTSFDAGLAKSLRMNMGLWHYGLMCALSIVVVSAFESVGAIVSVAMLIVPPMFAAQLTERLPMRLALVIVHAALSAVIGWHLSVWLRCSAAGAMVVAASLLFVIAWIFTGVQRWLHRYQSSSGAMDEVPALKSEA